MSPTATESSQGSEPVPECDPAGASGTRDACEAEEPAATATESASGLKPPTPATA